jgi:lysophospholipase L1-like esterase
VRRTAIALVLAAFALTSCGASDWQPASTTGTTLPGSPEPVVSTTVPVPVPGTNVLLVGDSIMDELVDAVRTGVEAGGRDHATFVLGPALPHTEAGVAAFQRMLDDHAPDVVVLFVGHWERLRVLGDLATGARDVPGSYQAEVVDPVLDMIRAAGARLLWLSPLPIRDPGESEFTSALGDIYRAALAGRDDAEFLDVTGGGFDPAERRSDGIHLCPDAQLRIARRVLEALRPLLAQPPDHGWAEAWRATVDEPGGCAPYDGTAG